MLQLMDRVTNWTTGSDVYVLLLVQAGGDAPSRIKITFKF
jgi:hypothetical protein